MRSLRFMLPLALGVVVCGLVLAEPGSPGSPVPHDGQAEDIASDPVRSPITYFNRSCANCHGDYGRFWGEGFAVDYEHAALRDLIDEMAHGPAFAPLTEAGLDVQTDYNASIAAGALFATAWFDGNVWRGEVTPKTSVLVDNTRAVVDGHRWTAEAPRDAKSVRLSQAEQSVTLKLAADEVVWTRSRLSEEDADDPIDHDKHDDEPAGH